jgi:membrane-associated phospholipid phosphatase
MMSQWHKLIGVSVWGALFVLGTVASTATAAPDWWATAKADLGTMPARLKRDAKVTFFDQDNLVALGWAGLASVAMNNGNADDDIADHFESHDYFGGFSDEALNVLGSPACHFPVAAIWYVVSADRQDEAGRQRALTMLTALTISGAVTGGLKMIRQNDQPDGQVWAWPSGHTASSFTVASVLHEFYGPKVGIPAYIGAGFVGWRMMDDGDHWASDILFGATLGWIVGHSVAQNHGAPEIAGFDISPYYGHRDQRAVGINFARQF